MPKTSKKAQEVISKKMHKMADEDMPLQQKLAIAFAEAEKKGLKVAEPKKKSNTK